MKKHMYFLIFLSCSNNTYEPIAVDSSNMVLVSSSSDAEKITFLMGFPDIEPGPYGNSWKETAQPQHEVTLSPFYIDTSQCLCRNAQSTSSFHNRDPFAGSFTHAHNL